MDPFDLRDWPGFAQAGGSLNKPAIIEQIVIDSRRITGPEALFVALEGLKSNGHDFIAHAAESGARFALVRRNWTPPASLPPITLLYVDNPLHAFQEIAAVYRKQLPAKVVAITGSYGKTMVKDLLQAILSTEQQVGFSPESFNSQIGTALSLMKISQTHQIALIEAAISKKNEMERLATMIDPDHVILTHIGKKHLATLGDMPTVTSELMKLPLKVSEKGWTLLPNDPLLKTHLKQLNSTPTYWNEPNLFLPHAIALPAQHASRLTYRIDFPDGRNYTNHVSCGYHYFIDFLNITTKAAWMLGASSNAICSTLDSYSIEPMRTEIWRSPTGITFVNDVYCSDPQSVDRSLDYLKDPTRLGRKIIVFSGMRGVPQHADYRRAGESIAAIKPDYIFLVGNHNFTSLVTEMARKSPATQVLNCATYQEAIQILQPLVRQEDTVLIKGDKKEPLDILTAAFNDSICTNQCLINLAAIEANITSLRSSLAPNTRIMVMVKALAYGTNDIRISKFLANCGIDILGVSYVDEAVALKRAGVMQSIFVINAALYEAAKVVKWDLEVGVSEITLIEALSREAVLHHKQVKVHLHVDTGMSRFGCRLEDALELAREIEKHPHLILEGIMTHFASADDPASDSFTISQAEHFEETIQLLKNNGFNIPWQHAANSSGVLRFTFSQFNMVRVGLAVYGLYTSDAAKTIDLRLAISLVSRIVGINTCKTGETISYGRSYTVNRDRQRIAVLPIGYFDGIHRNYSGKGTVLIRGQKAPMVGKICMDFMMVDITDIPYAAIGDPVLIFGEDDYGHYLSPEDLATSGDSIIHELITCLGPRIQRIFILEEASPLR